MEGLSLKRKQISITKKDYDLLNYIEEQGNASKFIWKCVRHYKEKCGSLTEDDVIRIVEERLTDKS